jgi:Ca2+-binding EF-hand superfamily protein
MRKHFFLMLTLSVCGMAANSQSLIPDLDASGARGEMARAEKKKAEARFDAMDSNKDGKLSREEVAGKSNYLSEKFDTLDSDKDGSLNWEEFLGHKRWPR